MTSVTDASPACPASHPISRMKQRSSIAGLLGLMIATAVTSAAIADTPTHITTREELVAVAYQTWGLSPCASNPPPSASRRWAELLER